MCVTRRMQNSLHVRDKTDAEQPTCVVIVTHGRSKGLVGTHAERCNGNIERKRENELCSRKRGTVWFLQSFFYLCMCVTFFINLCSAYISHDSVLTTFYSLSNTRGCVRPI